MSGHRLPSSESQRADTLISQGLKSGLTVDALVKLLADNGVHLSRSQVGARAGRLVPKRNRIAGARPRGWRKDVPESLPDAPAHVVAPRSVLACASALAALSGDELAEAIRLAPAVGDGRQAWCDVAHAIGTVLDAVASTVLDGVEIEEVGA